MQMVQNRSASEKPHTAGAKTAETPARTSRGEREESKVTETGALYVVPHYRPY